MAKHQVKAGDRITWTHYSAPGNGWREPFQRTGTVFDGAPVGNGLSNAWWVQPDETFPGEELAWGVLVVGRASRRNYQRDAEPARGEVYSSSDWRYQAAALTQGAARIQRQRAAAREAAGLPAAA